MLKSSIILALLILIVSCTELPKAGISTKKSAVIGADIFEVDSSTLYFPKRFFTKYGPDEEVDNFFLAWYSTPLRALKEPVLYTDSIGGETYRFTCLRSFHAPFTIRIWRSKDNTLSQVFKILDGPGRYMKPGALLLHDKREVTSDEWNGVLQAVDQAAFWNMPIQKWVGGTDGSYWIIEGLKDGKYHMVVKFSPQKGDSLYLLGKALIKTSEVRIRPLY